MKLLPRDPLACDKVQLQRVRKDLSFGHDDAVPASVVLLAAAQKAQDYRTRAKSLNTMKAYRCDWAHFESWCSNSGIEALSATPDIIAGYVADIAASFRTGTVERRLTAIRHVLRQAGQSGYRDDPALRETVNGIRRANGTHQQGKSAISIALLRAMVERLPSSTAGLRDRALLLLGYAAALRRSEIVGLDVDDVEEAPEGLILHIRRSKMDQTGRGEEVGVVFGTSPATCSVRAFRAWLNSSGIKTGPVFRPIDRHGNVSHLRLSGAAVAQIVQRAALNTGMSADEVARLGAHSLRSGHATAAARAGVPERSIANQGRWKSTRALRQYVRHGSLFVENSSASIGL